MRRKYPIINMAKTGQRIKRIMQVKGLKVKDIQRFLELDSPQSIYHWFYGKSLPTVDNLYALSELFNVPIDEMLVGNRRYQNERRRDIYQRMLMYYVRLAG